MSKPYTVAGLALDLLLVKDAIELLPTTVSERRFRETARAEGLNVLDGRQMMVRRNDITKVLEAMTCSKSKDASAPRSGRSSAPLRVNASDKALALLTGQQRKQRLRTSRPA